MSKYVYIKYFSFARRGVLTGCRAGQADVRGGLAGGYGEIQERGLARFPWRIVFKISREEDLEKVAEVKGGKKPDSPFFSNFRGVPQINLQISGQFCRKNYF